MKYLSLMVLVLFLVSHTLVFGETFTDYGAFEAAVGELTCVDFEGLATGGGRAGAVTLNGDEFSGVTLTAGPNAEGLFVGIPDATVPGDNWDTFFAADFFPTSGVACFSPQLYDEGSSPHGELIVDFDAPTTGVGAFFLDVEGAESYIEAFDDAGGTGNSLGKQTLRNKGDNSQAFAGVVADGIRSAIFKMGGGRDGVGIDDLCYGGPECDEFEVDAGDCQTVYYGYAPEECADLSASALGGTEPYSYSWSNGDETQDIIVCPTATTTYSVTVTDANGCTATDEVTVHSVDVHCGNKGRKVSVCHIPPGNPGNAHNICISPNAVPAHLAHGDFLGPCDDPDPCNGSGGQMAGVGTSTPVGFALSQNNPNPFARETSISYTLPASGHTTLKIYDTSGRLVETLVDSEISAGIHTVTWDRKSAVSGIYFYRLITGGNSLTKAMTVIR